MFGPCFTREILGQRVLALHVLWKNTWSSQMSLLTGTSLSGQSSYMTSITGCITKVTPDSLWLRKLMSPKNDLDSSSDLETGSEDTVPASRFNMETNSFQGTEKRASVSADCKWALHTHDFPVVK